MPDSVPPPMAAVSLDLWHTLIYLSPEDEEAYMAHQLAMGAEVLRNAPPLPGSPALTDGELAAAFERSYSEAVRESAAGRTVTPAQQLLNAARATGRAANPEEYLTLLRSEVSHTPFRLAPHAIDLVRELRERDYRLVIISNTVGEPGAFLRPILQRLGFDAFVESYIFSDEHPWTKPSPHLFDYALSKVGEVPANAVHVGDSWADLEGARRAGYRGAVLFTGLHAYGARYLALFMPGAPPTAAHGLQTERLEEVPSIVDGIFDAESDARPEPTTS